MNHIFRIALFATAVAGLSACNSEEDAIFDRSAAQILNDVSADYTKRMAAATNGWIMEYYPTNELEMYKGQGTALLAKFNINGTVEMASNKYYQDYSPYNLMDGVITDKSVWQVITDYGPVLSFNTYNRCLHQFAEPEGKVWDSSGKQYAYDQGLGIGGDYEFIMIDIPEQPDYAMIKGKKRGVYVRLSTLDEGLTFEDYYKDVADFVNSKFPSTAPNGWLLTVGDTIYNAENLNSPFAFMYPQGTDPEFTGNDYPFLITKHAGKYSLRFKSPVNFGGELSAQEFIYSPEDDVFKAVNNDRFTICGPDPSKFFFDYMSRYYVDEDDKNAKDPAVKITSKTVSDGVNAVINKLTAAMKAKRYSYAGLTISTAKSGDLVFTLSYKSGSSSKTNTVTFNGTLAFTDGCVVFGYKEPVGDATKLLKAFPEIQDLINVFCGSFKAHSDDNFVLNKLVVTSTADSGISFNVSL